MSAPANVLAAALRGHQLTKRETKRAAMFLELFLKLSDLQKVDVLRIMQAFTFVGDQGMQGPALKVAQLLAAEREQAGNLWGVIHEMRLLDQLPPWVKRMEVGTSADSDERWRRYQRLEDALEEAIPGFLPTRKRPWSSPSWASECL